VFLDPPYDAAAEYAATFGIAGRRGCGIVDDGALVVAEHRKKERLEERYGGLARTRLLEARRCSVEFLCGECRGIGNDAELRW